MDEYGIHYLNSTVVTTEWQNNIVLIDIIKNLNSTVVTTEYFCPFT